MEFLLLALVRVDIAIANLRMDSSRKSTAQRFRGSQQLRPRKLRPAGHSSVNQQHPSQWTTQKNIRRESTTDPEGFRNWGALDMCPSNANCTPWLKCCRRHSRGKLGLIGRVKPSAGDIPSHGGYHAATLTNRPLQLPRGWVTSTPTCLSPELSFSRLSSQLVRSLSRAD